MAEPLLRYIYRFKKWRRNPKELVFLYTSSDIVTIPKELYKKLMLKSINLCCQEKVTK